MWMGCDLCNLQCHYGILSGSEARGDVGIEFRRMLFAHSMSSVQEASGWAAPIVWWAIGV